ncbi:MAG: hypothetical protein AAF639_31505 [Chloroflexota bacterium]
MGESIEFFDLFIDELFVDREYEFDLFWSWGTGIPHKLRNSIALIGRRRTGKTSILVKLFNQLYFQQTKVMPIYVTFAHYLKRKESITSYEFAEEYFKGYLGCYFAFQYHDPSIIGTTSLDDLRDYATQKKDEVALGLFKSYDGALKEHIPHSVITWAINMPRRTAYFQEVPTAMIVDEFQVLTDVYDPRQDLMRNITGNFQRAVESRWAPMLVSGSSVSLLVNRALGGLLSGRFHYWHLPPLPKEDTHDLVFRTSEHEQLEERGGSVDEAIAEAIWQFTGGYPYSVHCLMTSYSPDCVNYPSVDALEKVILYELTDLNGKLRQHYEEEFEKSVDALNDGPTTRRVMLWATKYPDKRVDVKTIAKELEVDVKEVRESLEKLRWVDVVKRTGLSSYLGPSDPMLRRYIEYEHSIELDDFDTEKVLKDWEEECKKIKGDLRRALGEIGELYARMVMRGFEGQIIDGTTYFNLPTQITLPKFKRIERRGGIVLEGVPIEIDVVAEWKIDDTTINAWFVEAKYTQEPITKPTVQDFLTNAKDAAANMEYAQVTKWYFSRQGFTGPAKDLLKKEGILHSDWKQFLAFARTMGFFGLPKS